MDNGENFAKAQLRSLVERIERLEADKAEIGADIKEVFAEAKAQGFDTKIMRKVISLRKRDASERDEETALLDLYLDALGMTPLEQFIEQSVEAEVQPAHDADGVVVDDVNPEGWGGGNTSDDFPDMPASLDRRQSDAWGSV